MQQSRVRAGSRTWPDYRLLLRLVPVLFQGVRLPATHHESLHEHEAPTTSTATAVELLLLLFLLSFRGVAEEPASSRSSPIAATMLLKTHHPVPQPTGIFPPGLHRKPGALTRRTRPSETGTSGCELLENYYATHEIAVQANTS